MQATARKQSDEVSEAEYLALEAKSDIRHEYISGQIFAMAGGSPKHAHIGHNLHGSLFSRLRGKRCRGATGDQRIQITDASNKRHKTYSDALVVRPPERYDETDNHALLNPQVIFEVLSPSTQGWDRSGKFDLYKQIESLTDYVLIEQDWLRVEHYRRGEGALWTVETFNQRDQTLTFSDLEIELPLDEIYDGLDLPSGLFMVGRREAEAEELATDAHG